MTTITFRSEGGRIIGFDSQGHSGYAEEGEDIVCAAITSKMNKAKLPTHVELRAADCSISRDSVILLEQIRTIDKKRLREKVCHLDEKKLLEVDRALKVSFHLDT
mgnify:CR=1 FL=1